MCSVVPPKFMGDIRPCHALVALITEGDRSNLLQTSVGSEGLLTGEVRGRSFTRAYTSRSLSVHPDKPTIPLIAFVVIVHYHIPIRFVCQFFFSDFLFWSVHTFYRITVMWKKAGLCLFEVRSTKCLPAKGENPWAPGVLSFSIFCMSTGCLPAALFILKSAAFLRFSSHIPTYFSV